MDQGLTWHAIPAHLASVPSDKINFPDFLMFYIVSELNWSYFHFHAVVTKYAQSFLKVGFIIAGYVVSAVGNICWQIRTIKALQMIVNV